MYVLPRLRLAVARHPWGHRAVVALLAGLVALGVHQAESAADRARAAWGATRPVVVVLGDTDAGDPVRVEVRRYPSAMVPTAALREPPDRPLALHPLAAGEMLTADDLIGAGTVPHGWHSFAVPADAAPALAPGAPVGVFAGGRHLCNGVATAAGAAGDGHVEVAVPANCAEATSVAVDAGDVVLSRVR